MFGCSEFSPVCFDLALTVTTSAPTLLHLFLSGRWQRRERGELVGGGKTVGSAPDLPLPFAFEVLQFSLIKFKANVSKEETLQTFSSTDRLSLSLMGSDSKSATIMSCQI